MFTGKRDFTKVLCFVLMVLALGAVGRPVFADHHNAHGSADLLNMSLEELMDLPVTLVSKRPESASDAPGIVTVVTKEEIRTFGAKNLLDVLERMPSIYTIKSYMFGQNLVSVRGDLATHHNNHTLVLINGRPVRESIQGGLNYPLFTAYPIEMIERIELVRGPGSVLYGTNAFTGVINIITKEGSDSELDLVLEGGSHGYFRSSVSGGTDANDCRVYGTVQHARADGAHWRATDEAGVPRSLSSRQSSGSVATHLQTGPVTFDLFYTDQEMNHFGRAPRWSLAGNEMDTKRLFANLAYNLPLNDAWRLEPHVTFNYNRFVFETGNMYHQSRDVLGEITLFGNPSDALDLVAGYIIEHLATPASGRSSIGKYSQVAQSAYAQAGYQVLDNTRLIGGTQWNEPEDGDGDFISRFGAIIDLSANWGIKLLRGEAFRAPWPGETRISNPILRGNPNLDPERITTHDIQLFHHSRGTRWATTFFRSTMEDMIVRDTSTNPPSYINGGEMDFWGLEFEGKHYLNANLYVLGSVTHQESEEDAGINPSVVPSAMGKLGLGYENERLSAGVFYTHFSTPPDIPGAAKVNSDPARVHLLSANFDIDVTQWLGLKQGRARLTVRAENLLDQEIHYPEFNRRNINSIPGNTGPMIYAGVRIEH